ncbi:MAG: hypothetical protein N2512_04830 [Armatimonadetes bacterium]|nr:hypothetical protein [Armatimonadota bacterium]
MRARRLAVNAVLVAAVAFAMGHLLAVWHCQRDQLLAAREEGQPTVGPAQAGYDKGLGERRTAAVAGVVALAAAAWLGAAGLAEGLALFLAGYAVLGLTMTAQLVVLGYRRVPWPLLALGPGEDATSVLVTFGLLTLLIGGALYRAVASYASTEALVTRRPRRRRRTARRPSLSPTPPRAGRLRDNAPERPRADTAPQPDKSADWEDDDARSED